MGFRAILVSRGLSAFLLSFLTAQLSRRIGLARRARPDSASFEPGLNGYGTRDNFRLDGHRPDFESDGTEMTAFDLRINFSPGSFRDSFRDLIGMAAKVSAGILLYRRRAGLLEVLLVHPGGPFWKKKDERAWSIPKGEPEPGEDLLTAAVREFREEIGIAPPENAWDLGSVKQKGGKTVFAWAFEVDSDQAISAASNTFEIEWPPRSGKIQVFPEIDRAEFFPLAVAEKKINESQRVFLERLQAKAG